MRNVDTSPIDDHAQQQSWFRAQWKQNHGNLLLAFVAAIVLIGAAGLAYRQLSSEEPELPEAANLNKEVVASIDEPSNPERRIDIRVTGARTLQGSMVIAIYDTADSWGIPARALRVTAIEFADGVARWPLDVADLPDTLAVAAFHDENRDGVLTINLMGVAVERYGYSGGARFAEPHQPPSFDQVAIERPEPGVTLDLFIR